MAPKKTLLVGTILSILSFFCLSSTNVFVKLLDHQISIFQILFLQNVVGMVVMPFFCAWRKKGLSVCKSNHYGLLFCRALGGLAAFLFLFVAIQYVSVTNATLLFNTAPLFIPFILRIFFRERINHRLWGGIIPGFVGIGLILNPGANIAQLYAFFPLLSGVAMAILYIVLRELHFHKEPLTRVLLYLFYVAAIVTMPLAIYTWNPPTATQWILLACVSLGSFLAQSLITLSLRYGSPSALAPLCYTSVIFSLLYDWFIWHNIPSLISWLGILLVIGGGVRAIYIEADNS